MSFFAHSGSSSDKSDWQPLAEHLVQVANIAEKLAQPLGLGQAAFLAGLLHDLGKYSPAFQRRLEGGPAVDHSTAGAKVWLERAARPRDWLTELVAYAILGHHAGLPDSRGGASGSFSQRLDAFKGVIDDAWRWEILPHAAEFALDSTATPGDAFRTSVLGRMLFSCLVDADFKETEMFYARSSGVAPDRDWPTLATILPDLRARFDDYLSGKPREGELNTLRREVAGHIRAQATRPRGLYTLTVPTGGGKTLASLGFALDHARAHGMRRIVYAIPFTSIIDQTVAVFGEALGEECVLAHHASIEEDKQDARGASALKDKRRLAMEDWSAPIVVTTNVQLFESLFASRGARARKLHNIADSVIILDEAQTLPRPLLMPVLRMLEALCRDFGCTVVLCTATQPAFDKRNLPNGLDLEGRELAPEPKTLAKRLRRTTLREVGDLDNAALVGALAGEPQSLVIVNSRRHALELFRAARTEALDGLVHLTTRQCAAHRKTILADVRERLAKGAPCRVVATSLVEAGVDLDFPSVWRAKAGLDQIVQAAGRCNREGRRDPETSLVTIFSAPDYPPPVELRGLIEDMRRMRPHEDLLSIEAIENYFAEVYWRLGPALDAKRICADFLHSPRLGAHFQYRTAADKFRMIESGMEPVIVAFDEEAQRAVDKLAVGSIPSGALARALQTYVVEVPPKARRLLIDNGHVRFRSPEVRGEQFAVLDSETLYGDDVGLIWENADYLSADII